TTCTLEVKGASVKGGVVWVSRGRAGGFRFSMATVLSIHDSTRVLSTTRRGHAMRLSSDAITLAQELALLTIPVALSTLSIEPAMVAATTRGWHTTIPTQEEPVITLAPLLTLLSTQEGERQAWAGSWAGCCTWLIMAVCVADYLYKEEQRSVQFQKIPFAIYIFSFTKSGLTEVIENNFFSYHS